MLAAMRVLGLWLLYATVGALLLVLAMAGGGDLSGDDRGSPTRLRTKAVGAASGVAIAIAALGAYLLTDSRAIPTWPRIMVAAGAPLAVLLTIWAWIWIARDLRRRPARR
jgi:uncharacterized membrane protein